MFGQENVMTIEYEILKENHGILMKDYESLQERIRDAEESYEVIKLHLQNKAKELEVSNKRLLEECVRERSEKEKFKKTFEEMKKTMESERNAIADELMSKNQELLLAKRKEVQVVEQIKGKYVESRVAEGDKGGEEDQEAMESSGERTESDEKLVAMEPLAMYFPPSEYNKKIKISTRCHISDTVYKMKHLDHPMNEVEKDWFENHPQFKHILHMPEEENHKVMGIWMLLLRTAQIEKKKEVWFVVNGVPIRYSIREHALFSGLDCRSYPLNYAKAGNDRFKEKHFKDIPRIRVQDVREKLEGMKPGRSHERLKMLVLYFLCTILVGQRKNTGEQASTVDPFLLRAVDDLDFCTKFPWGRYSFDYMLRMISHTMTHFRGVVAKEGIIWPVPGFCIPLEFLAFEAIPAVGKECIEEIPDSDENCPRMCRIRFKKSLLKGWTLQEINDQLGTTTEIDSIIPTIGQEKHLLRGIMDDGEEDDVHDVVVDSWMRRMGRGLLVSFEDMYQADVASRLPQANVVEENDLRVDNIELVDLLNNMKESMQNQFETILERIDGIKTRIWVLEADVGLLKEEASGSTSQDRSGKKKKKKNKRESGTDITPHETKKKKHAIMISDESDAEHDSPPTPRESNISSHWSVERNQEEECRNRGNSSNENRAWGEIFTPRSACNSPPFSPSSWSLSSPSYDIIMKLLRQS